jgi:hypothetical protein
LGEVEKAAEERVKVDEPVNDLPKLPPIFDMIHPEKLRDRLERFHTSANLPEEEAQKVWDQSCDRQQIGQDQLGSFGERK